MAYLDKNHPGLSRSGQCRLLSLNRSGTYYKPKPPVPGTTERLNEIREIWEERPFYGYRRIHAHLRRQGVKINRKRVRRLMKLAGLQAIYPKPKTSLKSVENRTYPYLLGRLVRSAPDQAWATDITYLKLPQGYAYLIALMDFHSRAVLSWRLSNSLALPFCLEALSEALELYGPPDICNTDQGCQDAGDERLYTLTNWGVRPSMTGVGRCLDNIRPERFWRTLKYENAYIYGYESMTDAREKIGRFIDFYNQERPHQALGYKTPAEVYEGLRSARRPAGYVDSSLDLEIELPTYPQALYENRKREGRIFLK